MYQCPRQQGIMASKDEAVILLGQLGFDSDPFLA